MFMDIDGHPVDMSEDDSDFLEDWSMTSDATSWNTKTKVVIGSRNVKANPALAVSTPVQNRCETHADHTYHKLAWRAHSQLEEGQKLRADATHQVPGHDHRFVPWTMAFEKSSQEAWDKDECMYRAIILSIHQCCRTFVQCLVLYAVLVRIARPDVVLGMKECLLINPVSRQS